MFDCFHADFAGLPSLIPENLQVPLADIAGNQTTLLIGLAAFFGGIVLMFRHQAHLRERLGEIRDEKTRLFEQRKFRRRATTSAMIASVGVMIATMYWATEVRVLTSLVLMILALLVGIFGMAMLDLMSVSVQHLAHGEKPVDEKEVVEKYLKSRASRADDGELDTADGQDKNPEAARTDRSPE